MAGMRFLYLYMCLGAVRVSTLKFCFAATGAELDRAVHALKFSTP